MPGKVEKIISEFERKKAAQISSVLEDILTILNRYSNEIAYLYASRRLISGRFLPKDIVEKINSYGTAIHAQVIELLRVEIGRSFLNADLKGRRFETEFTPKVKGAGRVPPGGKAKIENDLFGSERELTTAVNSYMNRRRYGQTISARVWKMSNQWQSMIKSEVKDALIEGTSAKRLSKRLTGAVRYWPEGTAPRGVLKTPIENAFRLARNEINLAYDDADYRRWQQIDFIIGIEVRLSNNHPKYDMCDNLAGKYPKTFHFLRWHVNCKCIAIPILAPESVRIQLREYKLGIIDEKPVIPYIDTIPAGAKAWIKSNAKRIDGWKNKPYWVIANPGYL